MRHARSYAREEAIKGLYEYNMKKSGDGLERTKDNLALDIINDVIKNEEEINSYIKKHLKKWSITELNPVLLGILQVGVYELVYSKVDIRIIVSDCLKIGNDYLEDKEVKYIHFVLDKVNKEITSE